MQFLNLKNQEVYSSYSFFHYFLSRRSVLFDNEMKKEKIDYLPKNRVKMVSRKKKFNHLSIGNFVMVCYWHANNYQPNRTKMLNFRWEFLGSKSYLCIRLAMQTCSVFDNELLFVFI